LESLPEFELYLNRSLIEKSKHSHPNYLFRVKDSGSYYIVVKTDSSVLQSDCVAFSANELRPKKHAAEKDQVTNKLKGIKSIFDDINKFYIEIKTKKGSHSKLADEVSKLSADITLKEKVIDTSTFPAWHSIHDYEYYQITQLLDRLDVDDFCAQLEKLDYVIFCSITPLTENLPSPLASETPDKSDVQSDDTTVTPDFSALQTYLDEGLGMNIRSVWQRGTTGQLATIRHLDYGIYKNHEDFQEGNIHVVNSRDESNDCNHGTASTGCIAAGNNSFGVIGIAHSAAFYFYDTDDLDKIVQQANPGDIVSLDIQYTIANIGNLPMIISKSWWDAIKNLTEKQVIVLLAAGNGSLDLSDKNICRDYGDSGAILVGSCNSHNGDRRYSSNYGHYASLINSWGDSVVTTGYSSLQKLPGNNRNYTNTYSGTSSATPLCAGALALLQSHAKQRGVMLTPEAMKLLIESSDYNEAAGKGIGKRPNVAQLVKIIDSMVLPPLANVNPFPVSSGYLNYNLHLKINKDNEAKIHFDYRFSDIIDTGVVVYYDSVGPSELEWYTYGYSKINLPVIDEDGNTNVVYLKASKVNAAGRFTMNSAADAADESPGAFDLAISFSVKDNQHLGGTACKGVLPLYIKSDVYDEYNLPVRVNIFIN
jgi:subtilisin family serine protease